MGLVEFLEGAYKGGRLLFLLYDHDKQVKLRYKAIKDSGIKRLPNPSGVIVSESIKHVEKQALVNNTPKRKSALDEEIELSGNLGYYVDVHTPTNTIDPVEIRVSSKMFEGFTETAYLYHPYPSTADKVKKIKRLRKRLWERIKEDYLEKNSPKPYYELPSNGITSHYNDVIGGVFGAIGGLGIAACESLIKGYNAKRDLEQRRMELTREEWEFLTQNLNRHEKK
jgi:hypothetical protein